MDLLLPVQQAAHGLELLLNVVLVLLTPLR